MFKLHQRLALSLMVILFASGASVKAADTGFNIPALLISSGPVVRSVQKLVIGSGLSLATAGTVSTITATASGGTTVTTGTVISGASSGTVAYFDPTGALSSDFNFKYSSSAQLFEVKNSSMNTITIYNADLLGNAAAIGFLISGVTPPSVGFGWAAAHSAVQYIAPSGLNNVIFRDPGIYFNQNGAANNLNIMFGSATTGIFGDSSKIAYSFGSSEVARFTASGFTLGSPTDTPTSRIMGGSASLDFGATAAGACDDLTITVSGAADGNIVIEGVPNALASSDAGASFPSPWVSGANTVTVRRCCDKLAGNCTNPAAATVTVKVIQ